LEPAAEREPERVAEPLRPEAAARARGPGPPERAQARGPEEVAEPGPAQARQAPRRTRLSPRAALGNR